MGSYSQGFRAGLFVGILIGSMFTWFLANAQFFPNMPQGMRDMEMQRQFQQQRDNFQQQQNEYELDRQRPC